MSTVKCRHPPPCPWHGYYLWCRWRAGSGPGLWCVLSASCRDTHTKLVQKVSCLNLSEKNRHNRRFATPHNVIRWKTFDLSDMICLLTLAAAFQQAQRRLSQHIQTRKAGRKCSCRLVVQTWECHWNDANATIVLPTFFQPVLISLEAESFL